jgi:hypothetical protein
MIKRINKVKKWCQFLNENNNIDVDINFINKLSERLKSKDGVIDVDVSDIKYDEDNKLHFYNNVIRVIFENTSFYGFRLDKFNNHDADVDANKFNKFLELSDKKIDDYIEQTNNIKNTIPKIKNVVNYVDSLNLETNINIKKIRFSYWGNQLMITIYKEN